MAHASNLKQIQCASQQKKVKKKGRKEGLEGSVGKRSLMEGDKRG